MSLLKQLRATV